MEYTNTSHQSSNETSDDPQYLGGAVSNLVPPIVPSIASLVGPKLLLLLSI